MPHSEGRPLRLFVSFAPEDRELKDELLKHLAVLQRIGKVEPWTADRVRAGGDWRHEVEEALGQAEVALLLLSASFLASDFLQDVEVPQIFDRRARGGLTVIPVLLRTCPWEFHPWLVRLKPLPRDGEAVAAREGDRRDQAFTAVATEIADLVADRSEEEEEAPAAPRHAATRKTRLPTRTNLLHGGLVFLAVACTIAGVLAVAKPWKAPAPSTEVPAMRPPSRLVHCPPPFSDIRIGMTIEQLGTLFPPIEDISKCSPRLLGGDIAYPMQVPGADKKRHARCARAADIAGLTVAERSNVERMTQADRSGDPRDVSASQVYVYAQVRGSIRAGTVPEVAMTEALPERSPTALDAVSIVVENLSRGAFAFSRARTSRRELCAVIADSCDDLDPERVRKYVQGGYSLGQIDADAHSRVVYGKCRAAFLQGEKRLAVKLVRRAGALGGIGIARASRQDGRLKSDDPSTFVVYSTRSFLEQRTAKFGVMIANAINQTEAYWRGAVALVPESSADADWQSAVVWLWGRAGASKL